MVTMDAPAGSSLASGLGMGVCLLAGNACLLLAASSTMAAPELAATTSPALTSSMPGMPHSESLTRTTERLDAVPSLASGSGRFTTTKGLAFVAAIAKAPSAQITAIADRWFAPARSAPTYEEH